MFSISNSGVIDNMAHLMQALNIGLSLDKLETAVSTNMAHLMQALNIGLSLDKLETAVSGVRWGFG